MTQESYFATFMKTSRNPKRNNPKIGYIKPKLKRYNNVILSAGQVNIEDI